MCKKVALTHSLKSIENVAMQSIFLEQCGPGLNGIMKDDLFNY